MTPGNILVRELLSDSATSAVVWKLKDDDVTALIAHLKSYAGKAYCARAYDWIKLHRPELLPGSAHELNPTDDKASEKRRRQRILEEVRKDPDYPD
jgi:hypothetical protein